MEKGKRLVLALNRILTFVVFLIILVTIASCSKSHDEPEPPKPDDSGTSIEVQDKLLAEPEWMEEANVDYEKTYYYSDFDDDVSPNYTFKLEKNLPGDVISDPLDGFLVYDSQHIAKTLTVTNDGDVYTYEPVTPYEAGRYYTITIYSNCRLHFYNKDPEMKEFHFDITRENHIKEELKSTVKEFLFEDLISVEDVKKVAENQTYTLYFKKAMNLNKGEHFLLWDGKSKDNDSFYAKFISESQVGPNRYKVEFAAPDLSEIYTENGLDNHIQDYKSGRLEDVTPATKEELEEAVKTTEMQQYYYDQLLEYFPDADLRMDSATWLAIIKAIQINASIGMNWPGLTVNVSLTVAVPLEVVTRGKFKSGTVALFFQYYRKSTYSADASVSLRKFLGIPYWVDIAFDVSEVIDSTFRVSLLVSIEDEGIYNKISGNEKKQEDNFDTLMDYIEDNRGKYEQQSNKLQKLGDLKDERGLEGNELKFPLLKGRWPIGGIFDIYLDIDAHLKVEVIGMVNFSYTTHTVDHIINYRSGDDSKGGKSSEEISTSTYSILIGAKVDIELGLHVELGLGVCGLEKWVHISISVDVGFYMSFGGFFTIVYNVSGQGGDSTVCGAGFFEIGFYFKVSASLKIFVVDFNFNLVNIRIPFVTKSTSDYIISRPNLKDKELLITGSSNKLMDDLIRFTTIDIKMMQTSESGFNPEREVEIDGKKSKMFTISFKNANSYLTYKEGNINTVNGIPALYKDTLIIDVNDRVCDKQEGSDHFIEVPITFISNDAREIRLRSKDTNGNYTYETLGYEYLGKVFTINKTPQQIEGYDFVGYKNLKTGVIYTNGSEVKVLDSNTQDNVLANTYEAVYQKIIYHTINFYDGNNKLIKSLKLRHGSTIILPTETERQMEGYEFLAWSEEVTKANYPYDETTRVGSTIDIYGIYVNTSVGGDQ